jgi:hypothetical protein
MRCAVEAYSVGTPWVAKQDRGVVVAAETVVLVESAVKVGLAVEAGT